jgi:hypothetical protein
VRAEKSLLVLVVVLVLAFVFDQNFDDERGVLKFPYTPYVGFCFFPNTIMCRRGRKLITSFHAIEFLRWILRKRSAVSLGTAALRYRLFALYVLVFPPHFIFSASTPTHRT